MVSKKFATLAAGALLLASPIAATQAQAANGSALSLAGALQASGEESGGGLSTTVIAAGFIVVAFAVALIASSDAGKDDSPASP